MIRGALRGYLRAVNALGMPPHLFERYPKLSLPWIDLGRAPAAVSVSGALGLSVMDEGRVAKPYGGNKVRKLEWLLGDARAQGAEVLATFGAVGSHHVVATAVYARKAGLRPFAALYPELDTPRVRAHARIIDSLCEGWFPATSRYEVPLTWLRTMGVIRVTGRTKPYVVPAGGGGPLGTMAWVDAALELGAAVERGDVPRPERIVVALGSGGTAAGLAVGVGLLGWPTEIVAVRAVETVVGRRRRVVRLAKKAHALLARHGGPSSFRPASIRVEDGFFEPGYGRMGAAAAQASAQGERAGLVMEPTYTSKALAQALLQPNPSTLYVHTTNTWPLEPLLAEALPRVPRRLEPLLLAE